MLLPLRRFWAVGTCMGLVCAVCWGQQAVLESSRHYLDALGHSSLWDDQSVVVEHVQTGYRVSGQGWILSLRSGNLTLRRFSWTQRLDQIRRRGNYTGSVLANPSELMFEALSRLRQVAPEDTSWQVERALFKGAPEVANVPEIIGGGVGAEGHRVVRGKVVATQSARVLFDSLDGKVVECEVVWFDTNFDDLGPILTYELARSKARSYIESYAHNQLSSASAASLIAALLPDRDVKHTLAFGPLASGLGSVADKYVREKVTPLAYTFNFGPVDVTLHARTGEPLGGGISSFPQDRTAAPIADRAKEPSQDSPKPARLPTWELLLAGATGVLGTGLLLGFAWARLKR